MGPVGVLSAQGFGRDMHPPNPPVLAMMTFRLGTIPVRILPSFFITTVLLNYGLAAQAPIRLLVWAVIVLASVLAHELGHAAAGLAFGLKPQIDLHGFGGTTSWVAGKRLSPSKRIVIDLAGPFMGFFAAAVVLLFASVLGPGPRAAVAILLSVLGLGPPSVDPSLAVFGYESLFFVNVVWGLVNLLPMLPLDGGQVMAQGLDLLRPGRGDRPARIVSLAFAGAVLVLCFATSHLWYALLAASFVAVNWRGLKDLRAREDEAPMRAAIEKAYAALESKDARQVMALARPVALGAKTATLRAEGLQLMAFGFLLEGRLADADAAIAALPQGYAPHPSLLQLRTEVSTSGGAPMNPGGART